MPRSFNSARTAIKAINVQFEDDLKRFYSDPVKYKYIRPRPENNSFTLILKGKHKGTKKLLDDVYALKLELLSDAN